MSAYKKKNENDISSSSSGSEVPDKMSIYQDCLKTFNESPISPKKCRLLLAKLLNILTLEGYKKSFTTSEATTLFFSVSKLFQHQNNDSLRQMVYLVIKELSSISEDTLMVTSSIMKDIQSGDNLIKPNAVRTLTRVLDETTAFSAERLFKNCIVSPDSSVCSASLVSSYHVLPIAETTVKRYGTEAMQAIFTPKKVSTYNNNSSSSSSNNNGDEGGSKFYPQSSYMSEYHAFGLTYKLKNNDKIALMKLIQNDFNSLKNQFLKVEWIKVVGELIYKDSSLFSNFEQLLYNGLYQSYEAVKLEIAKLITTLIVDNIAPVNDQLFGSVLEVLKQFLVVPRTSTRFASVRLLNKLAMVAPTKISVCNPELESLINDKNRNISTFAITTLLKTGNSSNIASLISTINKFTHDVSDDFKIIIVDAIRTLSIKFPNEWNVILQFLIDSLKNSDGGIKFKNSVVDCLIDLVQFVPSSKESALENLCDFIEDCEYSEVLVRVLHILGDYGPTASKPSLYVRHIYNRVTLENSIIRSAAVVALSKFVIINGGNNASADPTLAKNIISLLENIKENDVDDEVRDRSAVALECIKENHPDLIKSSKTFDLSVLESKLTQYVTNHEFDSPFDISSVPQYSEDERRALELKRKQDEINDKNSGDFSSAGKKSKKTDASTKNNGSLGASSSNTTFEQRAKIIHEYTEKLYEASIIPSDGSSKFGKLLNSCGPVPLTEPESEFVISAIKHIFQNYIVLQYNIENTLTDSAVENVQVEVNTNTNKTSNLVFDSSTIIDQLMPGANEQCYAIFEKTSESIKEEEFSNILTFVTKEIDPATQQPFAGDEGFDDEYEFDPLLLTCGDYLQPLFTADFRQDLSKLSFGDSCVYNIKENITLQQAVDKIVLNTNCLPLENTQFIMDESEKHILKLFGKSCLNDDIKIGILIKMIKSSKGIALKAEARSNDQELCSDLVNSLI
ncbi:coatomer subunit gamma SCDLUD_005085 [Saccharomycodes ludwigii]|uniref:coatomer subunit gamma n=1 Tax=Saccharomycodes ludwigii TaxID=36035 RepID=UPI001E85D74D|nr:hypothetical protein SCDLUD_005085 [Saccharomycodes ludwigii]KAH3898753.1 hypothetical protein SCDLUD_005085 [Saccharomycodes ludwigii]